MNKISYKDLHNIDSTLAETLDSYAKKLTAEGFKSEYDIVIEYDDLHKMRLFVDNGFDISKSIEVSEVIKNKIEELIK